MPRCAGLGALALVCLLACTPFTATAAETLPPTVPVSDPLEAFNRRVFEINTWVSGAFYGKPPAGGATAPGYGDMMPAEMRRQISALSAHLQEPVMVAIDLVAGDLGWAANGAARFAINTTVGVLGTRDVATEWGYPASQTDAGLALCRAGIMTSPTYLVMPLLGPTNTRDLSGRFLTNVGIWRVLGLPLFYGYYGFTRLERAMLQPPRPMPDLEPGDAYAIQRDAAEAARTQMCATAR